MFYSATDRIIYKSPVGPSLDPLAVHRKLVRESAGKVNEWIADLNTDNALLVAEAQEQLVALVRSVFGLKPFTEPDGHTDSQAMGLLEDYLRYVEGKG